MRVAVTGAQGKLGRSVASALADAGHQVIGLDRVPRPHGAPGTGVVLDMTDAGQVMDAMAGVDERHAGVEAVVHLAAIPAPGLRTDVETFQNNIVSTFNVLNAVRKLGIRRIVTASSETLLGIPFDSPPPYIPLDEEYPARPETTYGLVKHLEEQLAIQLVRWDPELSITALRFSNVMDPADYAEFPAFDSDPMLRKWNLWSYIDGRDGAQAVVEHDTMLSIDKARRLLGYEPQHTWRRT